MSPFDYIKSISSKEYIWADDEGENYDPYIVNKGLSFMQDCVGFANEVNKKPDLDKKLQYDFLFNIISKGKRYSSWLKKEINPNIQIIANYFCINNRLAEKYLLLLSEEQIQIIINKMNTGGRWTKP